MARPGEVLAAVPLETRHFEDLGCYLPGLMMERVREAEQHAGELLGGRTVWMVNSAALGGGLAQLLRTPFGIRNHEIVVVSPLGSSSCRVTFT